MAFLSGLGRPGDLDTLRRKMQGSRVEVREIGRDTGRPSAPGRASSPSGHHKSKRKGSEVSRVEVVYVRRKSEDLEKKKGKGKTLAESKSLEKAIDGVVDGKREEITRKKSVRRASVSVIGPDGVDRRRSGDGQRAPLKRSTSQQHATLHHLPPSTSISSNRPSVPRRKTTFTDIRRMPRQYDELREDRSSRVDRAAPVSSRPPLHRSRSTRTSSGRHAQPSSRTSAHRLSSPSRNSKSSRPSAPPRHSTTTRQTSRPPSRPSTARASTSQSKSQPRPNIISSLFSSTPAGPEPELECVVCRTDCPKSQTVTLHCQHHMCHDCLKRVFELSMTDPTTMPPKCCEPNFPIEPTAPMNKLFSHSFRQKWNLKYEEATAKYKIYCPRKRCGQFIRHKNIHTLPASRGDQRPKRRYGQCSKCGTHVCVTCSGKFHTSRECPKDTATLAFQKIADEKGWQQCYNCKAMVEHNKGCNHMTCRCHAEFCILCGEKWKTCDCPMFDNDAIQEEHDRIMREEAGMPPPGGWFFDDEADHDWGMGGNMGGWDPEWVRMRAGEAARHAERDIYVNGHRVPDFGAFDFRRIQAETEALNRRMEREMHIHEEFDYDSSSSDPESDSELIFVDGDPHRRDLAARRNTHREEPRRRATTREEPGHRDHNSGGGPTLRGGGGSRDGGYDGNFGGEGRRLDEAYHGGGGGGGAGRRYHGERTRMRTASPPLNPYLGDDVLRRGHDILARPFNDQNDSDAGMLVEEINNGTGAANRRTGRANAPPMRRASTLAGIGTGVASRARRAGNGGGLNGRVSEWRRYVD